MLFFAYLAINKMDIVEFALKEVHYPLSYNLLINEIDKQLLYSFVDNNDTYIKLNKTQGSQPIWRLAAIYQLFEIIYSKDTTIILAAETRHLARKAFQTLLFPLNHINWEILPELETKTSHGISFKNGCEVKLYFPEISLIDIQNRRVLMFCHNIEPADFKQEKTVSLGGVCIG